VTSPDVFLMSGTENGGMSTGKIYIPDRSGLRAIFPIVPTALASHHEQVPSLTALSEPHIRGIPVIAAVELICFEPPRHRRHGACFASPSTLQAIPVVRSREMARLPSAGTGGRDKGDRTP
jgi:hypothetical protein